MAKKNVPQTAEMKAARASQQQATLLGLQQQVARTRSVSRGAYGQRSLRSSGNIDSQYAIGKYKDDPGALARLLGGGSVPPPIYSTYVPPARASAPRPTAKPKPKPKAKPKPRNPNVGGGGGLNQSARPQPQQPKKPPTTFQPRRTYPV